MLTTKQFISVISPSFKPASTISYISLFNTFWKANLMLMANKLTWDYPDQTEIESLIPYGTI